MLESDLSALYPILEIDASGLIGDSDIYRSIDNCLFFSRELASETCESELGSEFCILVSLEERERLSSPSIPSCFCSLYLSLVSIPESDPSILS